MTQLTLAFQPQDRELRRVTGRIAVHVEAFLREHAGQRFRMADLTAYVQERAPGAPGSAERVMRLLRRQGLVTVHLIDRAGSLYVAGERA